MLLDPPNIAGISSLQRQAKKILNQAKKENKPIFVTERSNISAVILSINTYKSLLKKYKKDDFWLLAQEKSLEFWNHPSNKAYEELL